MGYRFSANFLYAPELSKVRSSSLTSPGSNLGLMLEYRITPRLRVAAGLIKSVKKYDAKGSDYHPPQHYWTNYLKLTDVYANCRILDLPLNLRYDVVSRPQYALFAGAGLSSLLMRNERYRYAYYSAGQLLNREWTRHNGSNHFFSVLNLSAGYERALGGRWSVQGEPYVKIPLGGVGFGKVKLSSAGAFFSLKYSLLPMQPLVQP
ncbi:hypothetical protein [Hymenobacter jejuensis]|uniref:PorT family protein n=1 Tax=Hymenobacter jejuensis TaxID=2502781 RepID=A0A5B8A2F3_9BACT|nr:hypothetical protein [Hymenobacter jejuensis]QDA60856.1 hypothetical protein FHG12_12410 [Hymenobacter jejuensis]